jgi:hypothetical protein
MRSVGGRFRSRRWGSRRTGRAGVVVGTGAGFGKKRILEDK